MCAGACSRSPSTNASSCLNDATVYESCEVCKEDRTRSVWSYNDRCKLQSDQQTADIIRSVYGVVEFRGVELLKIVAF